MDILILILEIIGTVAFAASGAITAFKKDMDLLGVLTLALVTALGGGVIRDVLLGNTPPAAFTNPLYSLIAVATAAAMFIPHGSKLLKKMHIPTEKPFLVMDSLGLGVFTVLGIQTAAEVSDSSLGAFSLVFFGTLTGVGGGVLRDVLSGNTPYIFVKHFYATASILGAVACVALLRFTGQEVFAVISGVAVTFILRICASHFKWSLPKHRHSEEEEA